MDAKLLELCSLFNENNEIILGKYWLSWQSLCTVSSFILANNGIKADIDELERAKDLIKDQYGIFSNARGSIELPLMASMVASGNMEDYLADVSKIYEKITERSLFHSEFELLAAMVLASYNHNFDIEELVECVNNIYKAMRSNHPLITDKSDLASATVFALSGKDSDALLKDQEACYEYIKSKLGLFSGDSAQTISAILAVIDKPVQEKCQKVLDIIEQMKNRNMSLSLSLSMPVVGGFAAIDKPVNTIVDEIEEICEYLKGKKGFSFLELGKEGRITYGMMLSLSYNAAASKMPQDLLESTLTSITLIEIMLVMMFIVSLSIHHHNSSLANNK